MPFFVVPAFLTIFVIAVVWTRRQKCPKSGWPIHVNNMNKQFFPKRDHCPNCGVDFRTIGA